MDNILEFPSQDKEEDYTPNELLEFAKEHELENVIIIGDLPGGRNFFNTSLNDRRHIYWLLERIKHFVLTTE